MLEGIFIYNLNFYGGHVLSVKVSIIMPSLNVAPYIRQCVESVMNQTLQEIEILCIDAGSTDGTREIILELAAQDERIRLIDSTIKSYGYQVNCGIDEARGEYIGVVETDDYVSPNMFSHLYDLTQKYEKPDVAHADMIWVLGYNTHQIRHIFDRKHKKFYFKRIDNQSALFTHLCDGNIWDAIYRREFLLKNKIRCNESLGAAFQDIGFLQQVHTLAISFVYSDQPLYNYRVNREGSSSNKSNHARFLRQEWKFIMESHLIANPAWMVHRNFVYARLIQCFFGAMNQCINTSKIQDWEKDEEWLIKRVRESVEKGTLAEEYLTQEERQQLYLLLYSMDSYADYVRACSQMKQHHEEVLLQRTESGALIFGAGIRGRNVLALLRQHDRNVLGFSDNDEHLWGTMIDGVPVIAPEESKQRLGNGTVIICNKLHWEEILDQLHQLGFSAEKVHVYNP